MRRIPWLVAGALGMGCAGAPVPAEQLGASQAAVRRAEVAGARRLPRAAQMLERARLQLDEASQLIERGKGGDRVELLLQRAQADAELAQALTREAVLRAQAVRALAMVRQLRARRGM